MNDTADGAKLLQKIRRSYSRSRVTLTRLLELLNQEDVYKLVGKLTDVSPERWTALNDLLEEYRTDTARTNLLPLLLLKNIIIQTWTDKNTVISQIRRELEAGEISDTSEGGQDIVTSAGISNISEQQYHDPEDLLWHYLETGIISAGWKNITGSDALEILMNDTADGAKLLQKIRRSYSRSRATLTRLLELLNQEDVYKLVGKLTDVSTGTMDSIE
jgi:hypothetical protein